MKTLSTTALAVALALGGTALVVAPAAAQKKKEEAPKGPTFNFSKGAREPLAAAQAAVTAGDNATAIAKINEAVAIGKTPDDRFVAGQLLYNISQKTNDAAQQQQAFDLMLSSGSDKLAPNVRYQLLVMGGQKALQAGDLAKADTQLNEALKLNPNERDAYALLAETKVKAGKPAEGLAIFQQAMTQAKQSGQKLPKDYYDRAVNIAYTAKLSQQTEALTQEWLVAYPTKDSWRDSLVIWRDLNRVDPETQLDLMRLQRSAGALKGKADYMEYVDTVYSRNPGEAKAVLDEGVRAGFVNLSADQNAREINTAVTQRMGPDKASLPKSAADAKGPKGTVKLATNVADGFLGYGMWNEAAEAYRLALTKPGADVNLINTRLGMALFRAGDKPGATDAWSKVTGPRAGLVKYWAILMNQGPATA